MYVRMCVVCACMRVRLYLTRFNKIAIQARAHVAADKEAIASSRVHMYESKCMLPLRDNCLFCS